MTQPDIVFRPYSEARDSETLRRWLEADPVHKARYGDSFAKDEGTEIYVASADGQDVLLLRLSRVVRIEVQFPPKAEVGKIKLARALRKGLYKIAALFKYSGFREMIFESDNDNLKNYFKGLGFCESDYLTVPLMENGRSK